MMKAMWGVAAIGDIAAWWVNDDKWGTALNANWDNVLSSTSLLGLFRLIVMIPVFKSMAMPIAGITAAWELGNLYLINKAEGATPNTTSNATTIGYLTSVFGLAASAMCLMDKMESGDEDLEEGDYDLYYDEYYEEEPSRRGGASRRGGSR